jgi:hypothetical protein
MDLCKRHARGARFPNGSSSAVSTVAAGERRSTSVEIIELRRFRHFDSLSQNLALLVRRQKRDIGRIPPASDPDDAFDWSDPGRIDQPPAIFEIELKDGVEIGRLS